jgi:transcriptional regulator with XRE-family HTH domain
MPFGAYVRNRRIELGIGLNDISGRLSVSPAYWSRVERELENPPRDELIEKTAAILGMRLDDLFIEAERFPPDMQRDLGKVVRFYRRHRSIDNKT